MAKTLSPWCKQAKKELIDRDMTVEELAHDVGLSREYTSAIINGRVYSGPAVKSISDRLNIAETACTLSGN